MTNVSQELLFELVLIAMFFQLLIMLAGTWALVSIEQIRNRLDKLLKAQDLPEKRTD